MDQKKFEGLLTLIVPQVVGLISDHFNWDNITAAKEFYHSNVYSILEEEETKLWHLSPLTLFHPFLEERETGEITFPEGA